MIYDTITLTSKSFFCRISSSILSSLLPPQQIYHMKTFGNIIQVSTNGKGTYDITSKILSLVRKSDVQTGVAHIFVQHTSCSLIIMENADPSARTDLHAYFDRLVPENEPYFIHTYEGSDDMPSHIRMVLTGCSQSIPIINRNLTLGTWQGLFLFEHRKAPHVRNIAITILGT